jgi:hypothetical protein
LRLGCFQLSSLITIASNILSSCTLVFEHDGWKKLIDAAWVGLWVDIVWYCTGKGERACGCALKKFGI